MSSGDPPCINGIRLLQKISELGEGVAAHARNRGATASVLVDEVVDDIVPKTRFEVEHVMRNSELLADASRIVHGIERTARPVRHVFAVTKELHRRADYVVALLDEQARGH